MKQPPSQPERSSARQFAMFAAAIFTTLLVGSIVSVFYLARHATLVTRQTTTVGSANNQAAQQNAVNTPSGIYVGSDASIMRIDAQTGKTIWTYKLPATQLTMMLHVAELTPDGDTIYVALGSLTQNVKPAVLALNAKSGNLRWSHSFAGASVDDVAVLHGVVYVSVNDQDQLSLSYVSVNNQLPVPTVADPQMVKAAADNKPSGYVDVLNAADGSERTKYSFDSGLGHLTIANGVLYLTTSNGLSATRLSDGKQLWSYAVTTASGLSLDITTPHVIDGVLYTMIDNVSEVAGSTYGVAAAFEASTGKKIWQTDKVDGQVFDLTVANNVVYFGSIVGSFKGVLYAYDARQGKLLWSYKANGGIQWAPSVADGVVYASAYIDYHAPEEVVAVNAADGSEKWKTQVGPGIMTTPFISNGVVYVGSGGTATPSSKVYALKVADGSAVWNTQFSGMVDAMTVVP